MTRTRDGIETPATTASTGSAGPLERSGGDRVPASVSKPAEIEAFLGAAKATDPLAPRGRLIFALDATMSRQPTWDRAVHLQAAMFEEAGRIGGLDVQLVFFRGFGECRASRFVRDARALADLMVKIDCRGGKTQIERVLGHAATTAREQKVAVLVYIGDAMEENVDALSAKAGELALLGTKVFLFQEGSDPAAGRAFAEIARLTKGAHLAFDAGSADRLGALLKAAAVYAAGGLSALERLGRSDRDAAALLTQMR